MIMTTFSKVDLDITAYKPKMKAVFVSTLSDLKRIPITFGQTTVQTKADGEFNFIHIDRKEIYAINRFGRKTEDLPALRELHVQFLKLPVEEIEFLAEMYAVGEDGKPLSLPNFVHYLKGEDKSLHNRIHLGLFDVVKGQVGKTLSFEPIKNLQSSERFKMMKVFTTKLCHVLEWIEPKVLADVEQFWKEKVEKEGWEGLVIRTNGDTYKAKPNRDIDAVIIGINKNNKGFDKELAKSIKVALMRDDGSFVELGDATVPSNAEAQAIFELTRVKVNEDATTVFVKPLVIVKIDYISLFPETTNRVYKLLMGGFTEVGTQTLVRMKSPRVVGYRKDKHVCPADVGLNQIDLALTKWLVEKLKEE